LVHIRFCEFQVLEKASNEVSFIQRFGEVILFASIKLFYFLLDNVDYTPK